MKSDLNCTSVSDYKNYAEVNFNDDTLLISTSIDNMLTRLEEFESMIKMVQQQTGNVIGITGTFSQIKDQENNLTQLCLAVDVLEGLVLKVKTTLDSLEDRVLQTEKQYEYLDNNTLKSFFKPIFLKKSPDVKVDASNIKLPTLDIQDIFKNTSDNN